MTKDSLENAVSDFGASAKAKLKDKAISGGPEDQLRSPLEKLIERLSVLGGLPEKAIGLVGEAKLSAIQLRPDYAVSRQNALVGFIEVTAV
jgi:hypothetical protein